MIKYYLCDFAIFRQIYYFEWMRGIMYTFGGYSMLFCLSTLHCLYFLLFSLILRILSPTCSVAFFLTTGDPTVASANKCFSAVRAGHYHTLMSDLFVRRCAFFLRCYILRNLSLTQAKSSGKRLSKCSRAFP